MADLDFDDYFHGDSAIFYTDTNIPGPGAETLNSDVSLCVKCSCGTICGVNCGCVCFSGGGLNYINHHLSDDKMGSSSFVLECNEFCECSSTCGNRLVQFGPRKRLLVFQTGSRDYGLRTELSIKRGSFICEYAGELIDKAEAKRRAQYDAKNYIFVLREHFSESVTETIIDPTCIGNIGRYINHSCQPNAAIFPVRIDSPVPRLAVFAIANIEVGEEITYDYSSGGKGTGTTPCLCGTEQCRGFLPFDKDLLS